ncbi:MAG: L,D-transpeptidase family protein [Acidobacteria bacterium]|nr:L,D-transpeptidase family protein [Acidobacteriota bacterium]MCA1638350.1 L,D-transpeptidase family protein [Acidobacteriota bacterium]
MKLFVISLILVALVFTAAFGNFDLNPEFPRLSEPLPRMKNPRLVVKKKDRRLELYDGEKLIKHYEIALGFAPEGEKEKQGDGKTPEGEFYIFTKNDKSKFYLSLGISYPNIEDAERGLKAKLITKAQRDEIVQAIQNKKTPLQNTALGGEIYIHGGGSVSDWTWGCVALKNEEIKELFDALQVGTIVKIEP